MSKAAKHRDCPALNAIISSAECGEHRHSRCACPEGCPHNPFAPANYESLLTGEGTLDDLTMRRLLTEEPEAPGFIAEAARRNAGHGGHAAAVWRLFFRPDPSGRTFAARWAAAELAGLKNDQRVLLRGKMRMRVALLEMQQVVDERTIQAVDLLDPGRPILRIVDRRSAARLVRFASVLTWVYPLPHFWRMSGTGAMLPDLGPVAPEEAVLACIRHLGGPGEAGPARALWLTENFCRVDEAIAATAHERRRLMFNGMDAQFGKVTYALEGTLKKCREALLRGSDVAEDELSVEEEQESFKEAWVWFEPETDTGLTAAPKGGRKVKGRVLLGARKARIEAMGQARLARLKEGFETRLGPLARFTAERRDDLGRRMVMDEPAVDSSLVPSQLLTHPLRVELQSSRLPAPPPGISLEEYNARLKIDFLRRMLDEPLPALAGRPPRQAAGDMLLRPTLLRIMKNHVRQLDEDNLRTGRADDISEILRELGLHEIDFPAPPPRPRLDRDEDDDDPWNDMAESTGLLAKSDRPSAPVLIGPPLELEQAFDRLDGVMQSLATAGAGMDELDRSGSTVLADADELAGDWMTDDEFSYFVTFVLQAWFVLVPCGVRAPALRLPVMQAAFAEGERLLRKGNDDARQSLERFSGDCRQPALLHALLAGIMAGAGKVPKKMRPSPQAIVGMSLVLRVVLDELDQALRAR